MIMRTKILSLLLAFLAISNVICGQSYHATHSQQFIKATNDLFGIKEEFKLEPEEDRKLSYNENMLYVFNNQTETDVEVGMLMDKAKFNHFNAKKQQNENFVDGYTWVFVLKNLKEVCDKKNISITLNGEGTYTLDGKKGYEATERLSKLLGIDLFPEHIYICTFKVPIKSLFRPAYQTSVYKQLDKKELYNKDENKWKWDETGLSLVIPPKSESNYEHLSPTQWLASLQKSTEYPWTRMGYTYDWDVASTNHIGVSEFVIVPGTVITDVKFYKEAELAK